MHEYRAIHSPKVREIFVDGTFYEKLSVSNDSNNPSTCRVDSRFPDLTGSTVT